MRSSAFTISINKRRVSLRGAVFLLATLFLHLLALQSTNWTNWLGYAKPGVEKIVSIQLRTETPAVESAAIRQVADLAISKPKIKKKSTAISAISTLDRATEYQGLVSPAELPVEMPSVSSEVAAKSEDGKAPVAINPESTAEKIHEEPLPLPEHAKYAVRAPDSVRIEMALVRTKPDTSVSYGVGSLSWTITGSKYNMSIEAGLDLIITSINLYKLTSEGHVDKFGITPDMSTEARRTRASTATHFHHDDKTISFSSSSKVVLMDEGAQDKASFLMQLASIGNADERQFYAGREFEIQVAEERDAALFHFLVTGKEEINTKLGKISTWHLLRAARPGSYNSQLDIWLAPDFGWYPVQIRNTESNGTVTEQSATKLAHDFNVES